MAGLKRLLLQVPKGARCIWKGSSRRKAKERSYILNQWNDEDLSCDEVNTERQKIKKYKHNFEKELWRENEQKYLNGEVSESVLKDSSIEEIDLALINWFKDRWLADSSSKKIQFYLWLEAIYVYHLKKYNKNKREHFESVRQQSHSRSLIKSGKSIYRLLTGILAFGGGILYISFLGRLKELCTDLLNFINTDIIQEKTIENVSFLFALLFGIISIICLLRIFYKEQYYKERIPEDKKKETWVRHVTAIQAYQKVILEYLEDVGDFAYYICPQDKENYLMSQMISVWKQNAELFQENMRKESKGK